MLPVDTAQPPGPVRNSAGAGGISVSVEDELLSAFEQSGRHRLGESSGARRRAVAAADTQWPIADAATVTSVARGAPGHQQYGV